MSARVVTDEGVISYVVPEESYPFNKRTGRAPYSFAQVEAWWSNGGKGTTMLVRQESNDTRADVLELSLGQVYDLIDALNRALGLSQGPKVEKR